jgi:hypothetical protein
MIFAMIIAGSSHGSDLLVWVGLTHQHTNREVLVEGPEIMIRPVGTRRVVAGGSR